MKRVSSLVWLFLGFIALGGWTGCAGYHIGPDKPIYLAKIKTLAIPEFKNLSLEPRIESVVTDSVIVQFQQDGTYQITDQDHADAILEGAIITINRSRARSVVGNIDATSEFTLNIQIGFKLTNRITGEVLDRAVFTGSTNYFVGSDLQQQERQAVVLAADEAAKQIVGRISDGF